MNLPNTNPTKSQKAGQTIMIAICGLILIATVFMVKSFLNGNI